MSSSSLRARKAASESFGAAHGIAAAFGSVTEANLMMDRTTNRPRGFGFVTMSTDEEAQKAIQALNGKDMGGRTLAVSVAKPREERAPACGGGRRDYGGGGGRRY